jgi:hypothetical protein
MLKVTALIGRLADTLGGAPQGWGGHVRLDPAAAIVRRYGEQFRRLARRRHRCRSLKPPPLL